MNQCQIAVHQAFRANESDSSIDRAFARWVRAVEALVGFKVDSEPFSMADELFADGLTPEEAFGEYVPTEPTAREIAHEELTAANRQEPHEDDDSALGFDVTDGFSD